MKVSISNWRDMDNVLEKIYGRKRNPYYIYAPRWIDSSAGIKHLHFFCHSLNSNGELAFLVLSEKQHGGLPRVNPNLLTPILTQEICDSHFNAGLTPITVYSESVPGNPLNATCIVRYLMNYSAALGGVERFPEMEHVIAYSKKIAIDYAVKNKVEEPPVHFLPPIDPRDFKKTTEKENFQLIYAGKYRSFVGVPPKIGTLPSVEIFRDGPRMQKRSKVIELLSKATVVYVFENSSVATEATLSGTPVHFVSNPFLGEIIADVELGPGGIVKDDSPGGIEAARATVDEGIERYYMAIKEFPESLKAFIVSSQFWANSEGYVEKILVPNYDNHLNRHKLALAKQILKNKGFFVLLRVTSHYFKRKFALTFRLNK